MYGAAWVILVHERRSVAGSWFANDGVKTVKMVKIVKSGVHAEWLMVDGGNGLFRLWFKLPSAAPAEIPFFPDQGD